MKTLIALLVLSASVLLIGLHLRMEHIYKEMDALCIAAREKHEAQNLRFMDPPHWTAQVFIFEMEERGATCFPSTTYEVQCDFMGSVNMQGSQAVDIFGAELFPPTAR